MSSVLRALSVILAVAGAAPLVLATPLTFSASFTPTLKLTSLHAFAAYGNGQWRLLGDGFSASPGGPSSFTATTDDGADGRFALLGVYTIPPTDVDPATHVGVSVVMTSTNAAFALDDGTGAGRPFTGPTGVFPFYQEDIVRGYLDNGGQNLTYILNTYDFGGQTNRYVVGSGTHTIVNFSNATPGGTATVSVRPVPEPSAFLVLGLSAVGVVRRRCRENL